MSRKIEIPNIDNVIERYESGVSLNQLSKEVGIARITLTRRFESLGVNLRSQSDSERLKWSKMTETQRKRQVQKAHEASRGRLVSTAEKIKRAKSAYLNNFKKGRHELELIELLRDFGYDAVSQLNFGIYNLDISVHGLPIAIEIQTSNHQLLRRPKHIQRTKYILGRKYFLIYVIIDQSKNPLRLYAIANKIISYLNVLSLDKSIVGKYAMIGRDGKPFPSSCYDFNGHTRIE
jgi:hypothetical protein